MNALFLIIAVIAFASTAFADTKLRCQSNGPWSAYALRVRPTYDHDRYGTWPRDLFFEFGAFQSSFDSDDDDTGDRVADFLAIPHWVAYEIRRYGNAPYKSPKPSPKRPKPWYEMPELGFLKDRKGISKFQIDKSYSGFGKTPGAPALDGKLVNRGHFAMKAHAQRLGWREACNTHVFVNAAPQQKELNQGIWLDLEAYSGAAANKFQKVWIVTGSIFDPNKTIKYIQNDKTIPVAVPHKFFKIILKENTQKKAPAPDVLALWFDQPDNTYIDCNAMKKEGESYDYSPYFTSIKNIEKATGLEFLRNVYFKKKSDREAFKTVKTTELWPVEDKYYGVKCTP